MNGIPFSRRAYLTGVGAAATTGLAGCLGGGTDALTVAHMPIFPDLQYYVMDGKGYFDEIDAEIDGQEFTDGPAIIQAYGGGDIDIGMFGIVPAMIVMDRGLPAKVTATNIKEPMGIMVHGDLQAMWNEHGVDAFGVWEDETGEPFDFGTFPQGSVPDVLLRHWLSDTLGVDPESAVEITEIGGANAVFQAFTNGEVDGTSIMEPVPTRVSNTDSPISMFRTAAEIMPGQPAAVTLMTDEIRNSDLAEQFLEQHIRATDFIDDDPDATADIIEDGIGMDREVARQALDSPLSNFVTDPREIEDATDIFAEFAHENGQIDQQPPLDEIFDYSVYENV